jgi:hypothetical protein
VRLPASSPDQGSPQGDGAIRAGNRPVIVFRSRAVSDREQQFRAERRPRDPANAAYTNALAKYSF